MTNDQLNLIVLDGFTLNPGDLSWDGLERLADCTIYDRTPAELVSERARDAELVLTNKAVLDGATISELAKLRYIGVLATGYDIVDVEAARQRGIVVTNIPTYGTASVAQMVFAHVLNIAQHVSEHARDVHQGQWSGSDDWCFWNHPLLELAGMTMGIVGFGRIGRATARLALAFGMKVIATSQGPVESSEEVTQVDLETVFRQSDFVSLHCPLTAETEGLVNQERLGWMKETAYLINTSRGPLVDDTALAAALNSGILAGAGLDVLSTEPPLADNPLLHARNCHITPHIAWATRSARQRLLDTAVENVDSFVSGTQRNVVN
ncbi:MAG: D-2-hydroxyacid dehydrogenase [Planctomycetales bacterium]